MAIGSSTCLFLGAPQRFGGVHHHRRRLGIIVRDGQGRVHSGGDDALDASRFEPVEDGGVFGMRVFSAARTTAGRSSTAPREAVASSMMGSSNGTRSSALGRLRGGRGYQRGSRSPGSRGDRTQRPWRAPAGSGRGQASSREGGQDLRDECAVLDERDDLHWPRTPGAGERIHLVALRNQPCPRAPRGRGEDLVEFRTRPDAGRSSIARFSFLRVSARSCTG